MDLPERKDLDVDDFKSRWQLSPEQLATTKRTEDELEEPKRDDKYALQPRRMRTHILKRIPIMYDEPPNSQPRFRWVTSEWHFANPTPEMKKWNEKYRSSLGRMQGSMI